MSDIPEVRNESEDFRWDLVDWCEAVSPGSNQAEDLENVLLESVELKTKNETRVSDRPHIHLVGSTSVVSRIPLATLKGRG